MDGDEPQGPLPTPQTLPPSHPNPSQVGEGLPAGGDRAMLSLAGGGGVRAAAAGVLPSMSLSELLQHFSRSGTGGGSSHTTASSRTSLVHINHPKPSNPTGQLRQAHV